MKNALRVIYSENFLCATSGISVVLHLLFVCFSKVLLFRCVALSCRINIITLLHVWEGNTGEYSVRGWQYWPDRREGLRSVQYVIVSTCLQG